MNQTPIDRAVEGVCNIDNSMVRINSSIECFNKLLKVGAILITLWYVPIALLNASIDIAIVPIHCRK